MRKLLMAATMLTTIGFASVTTALADGYRGHDNGGGYGGNSYDTGDHNGNYSGGDGGEQGSSDQSYGNQRYGDHGGEQGFDRYDDRRDRDWERSWRRWDNYRDQDRALPAWKLERRIERQGYFNVRNLHPSRFGYGWKAFAQDRYGRPVVLRINPYSGRVLDVRVIAWR